MAEVSTTLYGEHGTTRLLAGEELQKPCLLPYPSRRSEGGLRTKGHHKQSFGDKPLISIVTVVLNGENDIEEAIRSVVNQAYENVEYIIIDGGSNDGTLNVIKKYEYAIDYWVSEPDNGIYDAMNKGVEAASGEWLQFLGSDDCIYSRDTLSTLFDNFDSKCKLLYGDIIYSDGRVFRSRFGRLMLFRNAIHHQAAFYNKELFRNFRYDTSNRILSDYELNLRLYRSRIENERIDRIIAICDKEGVSRRLLFSGYKEEIRIRNKYVNNPVLLLMLNIQTILRFILKRFVHLLR